MGYIGLCVYDVHFSAQMHMYWTLVCMMSISVRKCMYIEPCVYDVHFSTQMHIYWTLCI